MAVLKYKDTDGTWKELPGAYVNIIEGGSGGGGDTPTAEKTWHHYTLTYPGDYPTTGYSWYYDLWETGIDFENDTDWFIVYTVSTAGTDWNTYVISPILNDFCKATNMRGQYAYGKYTVWTTGSKYSTNGSTMTEVQPYFIQPAYNNAWTESYDGYEHDAGHFYLSKQGFTYDYPNRSGDTTKEDIGKQIHVYYLA